MTGERRRLVRATVVTDEPRRVDGLCPTCLTPSVWQVASYTLSELGVGSFFARTACDRCGEQVGAAV